MHALELAFKCPFKSSPFFFKGWSNLEIMSLLFLPVLFNNNVDNSFSLNCLTYAFSLVHLIPIPKYLISLIVPGLRLWTTLLWRIKEELLLPEDHVFMSRRSPVSPKDPECCSEDLRQPFFFFKNFATSECQILEGVGLLIIFFRSRISPKALESYLVSL